VVAVGTSTDTNENYDPLIEQWNGRAWTVAAVPEIFGMPTTVVTAVVADKTGGSWAVGWGQKDSPLTYKTYIVRRSPRFYPVTHFPMLPGDFRERNLSKL
jgi:hypothetical protein